MHMLREIIPSLIFTVGVAGISLGQAQKATPQPGATPTTVADPNWRPSAGDRATVRLPDSPGFPDRASCERYIRFSQAGDSTGMAEMAAKPGAGKLAAGTSVLVVAPHGLPRPDTTSN